MMYLLSTAVTIGFVWWLTRLPRTIRETLDDIKNADTFK